MKIEIARNIELPPRQKSGKRIYPFAEMNVGDSFAVPEGMDKERARVAAVVFGIRAGGWKFSLRTLPGGEARIWRVR